MGHKTGYGQKHDVKMIFIISIPGIKIPCTISHTPSLPCLSYGGSILESLGLKDRHKGKLCGLHLIVIRSRNKYLPHQAIKMWGSIYQNSMPQPILTHSVCTDSWSTISHFTLYHMSFPMSTHIPLHCNFGIFASFIMWLH